MTKQPRRSRKQPVAYPLREATPLQAVGLSADPVSIDTSLPLFRTDVSASFIRTIISLYRHRADHPVFAHSDEPSWAIMLDIYACALEEVRLCVTAIGIAAGIPPTTAQRWINKLAGLGLLEREADPTDQRRIYVRLSPSAMKVMREWHVEAQAAFGRAAQNKY
ncbi:MarR family transcriptional regulator [Sphingobium yanoikuyae]|uniref:MarR family transcriptional regulator n=1 Tax=Sphingobium yanoikuyae TaxID=13690 RepID=UPI0035C6B9E9